MWPLTKSIFKIVSYIAGLQTHPKHLHAIQKQVELKPESLLEEWSFCRAVTESESQSLILGPSLRPHLSMSVPLYLVTATAELHKLAVQTLTSWWLWDSIIFRALGKYSYTGARVVIARGKRAAAGCSAEGVSEMRAQGRAAAGGHHRALFILQRFFFFFFFRLGAGLDPPGQGAGFFFCGRSVS